MPVACYTHPMVYRIQPKPYKQSSFILRSFVWLLLLVLLVAALFFCVLGMCAPYLLIFVAVFSALMAFYAAWLMSRPWKRMDFFNPAPQPYFLTVVDEGLVIESPAKGFTVYLPWQGMSYRFFHGGRMLYLFSQGVPRSLISLNGVAPERRAALLADLQAHMQPAKAAPATPQADVSSPGDALPPVPVPMLPPPTPLGTPLVATCSDTEAQRRELNRLLFRLDALTCGTMLVVLLGVGTIVGREFAKGDELSWFVVLFFTLGAAYFLRRIMLPGRRTPRCPGVVCQSFTQTEYLERLPDGGWARFCLPDAAGGGYLVRLPQSWCLYKPNGLAMLVTDASGDAPPPALAHYPVKLTPRNALRGVAAVLILLCGWMLGWYFTDGAPQAERDFRAMLPEPSEAALSALVKTHYLQGELLHEPALFPQDDEESGETDYWLYFADTMPHPQSESDGEPHFAWVTCVGFTDSGRQRYLESWAVHWCPCAACLEKRLEELAEPAEEEADESP